MRLGTITGGLAGPRQDDESQSAWLIVVAGFCITLVFAFGAGVLLNTPAAARVVWSVHGIIFGIVAAFPLCVLLHLLMQTDIPPLVRFRDSQIQLFARIGFVFTKPRIFVMALAAGVSEELLFRGVLQVWSSGFLPVWLAIASTNVVFGALHARTLAYALIAGAIGVYLGALFEVSGNLLTPIMTHIVYDAVALEYTRRAVRKRSQQT